MAVIKVYFKPMFKRPPPIHAKRYFCKKRRQTLFFRVVSVLLVFFICCVICDIKMRPIVRTAGGTALKNSLSGIVDGAVNDIVDELGVRYADMVNIEKNPDGTIGAVTLNSSYINAYKSEVSDKCSDRLAQFEKTKIPISLGTVAGASFLNFEWFEIDVTATIYGFAVSGIESSFESAGINQTRHTIYLQVEASAYAYVGLCRLEESVDETIILVETIIVGDVPQSYYIRNN